MIIVVVIFYLKAVASAILRGPCNVAVVAGTNMTMTCDPSPTTNTVDWYYTPVRNNGIAPTVLRINQGSKLFKNFSQFSVDGKIPGQLLSLNFTQLEHAGVYQCTATGEKATAELIVLASEPRCSFTSHVIKEVNRGNLFCSVSYSGYSAPAMEWSQIVHGPNHVRAFLIKEYSIESRENELSSSLNLVINASTKSSSYSCKTYFKNISSGQASTTASNIPRYESVWTSPVIGLLYGPKNVTVFPVKNVFHPDDVLTCTSDSTPSLEFEWIETDTGNVVFTGSNIIIHVSMVRDEPYSFLCTGIDKLTNAFVKSSVLKFVVKNKSGDDESTVATAYERPEGSGGESHRSLILIISIPVASFLMSIAFAGFLMVFCRKRKRKRMSDSQKEHDNTGTVTPPAPTAEDTSSAYAVATESWPAHQDVSVDIQPTSLPGALSGSYEEIDMESVGVSSNCYNLNKVAGERNLPQNDDDLGSNGRKSNSSSSSNKTVKSTRYEDLLERDLVKPSVYLRLMPSHKGQEAWTSNSPTSSEEMIQSQTTYVNWTKASSDFSLKA